MLTLSQLDNPTESLTNLKTSVWRHIFCSFYTVFFFKGARQSNKFKKTPSFLKNIYNVQYLQTYWAASSEPTGFLFFHERNEIDKNPVGSEDDWTATCNLLDEFLRSCIYYMYIYYMYWVKFIYITCSTVVSIGFWLLVRTS